MKEFWDKVKPTPKVAAAAIVGALIYALGALGIDTGQVLQDITDVVGIELPDQDAFAVLLGAALAGWLKSDSGLWSENDPQ